MEAEVRTLREDLENAQESLKAATRKCRMLVHELDNRTASYDAERKIRDQQLSRILRALLILEARLKQEQKSIRQLLCEKDNVIRTQQLEIAKLRRYTKNYIKGKRDQNLKQFESSTVQEKFVLEASPLQDNFNAECDSGLSKDIQKLKCEIITKLANGDLQDDWRNNMSTVQKTNSFTGSDISKTSLTSENTDISATTTDGSPSLLSTEGFCEGDSTDVSPSSTLNKSNRCTPTILTDSENETKVKKRQICEETSNVFENIKYTTANETKEAVLKDNREKMVKSASEDDGMDCTFVSDEEEKDEDERVTVKFEPIYANDHIEKNIERAANISINEKVNNTVNNSSIKIGLEEQGQEEPSSNWYSDPDEDRNNDDAFQHTIYQSNSNHNSVLECVNQILLRDMEEEESILSMSRRYKHRGKFVCFQAAKLSDIESVGSEVERRNSEEVIENKFNSKIPVDVAGFQPTAFEDEFGMKKIANEVADSVRIINSDESDSKHVINTNARKSEKEEATALVIIEPKEVEIRKAYNSTSKLAPSPKSFSPSLSPSLKMERMKEKVCLQMPSKRLSIAKNLDYEDIESLSEISFNNKTTPSALSPKTQFQNNTLILKKIPSPSFLIDESRKKHVNKAQIPDSQKLPSSAQFIGKALKFDDVSKNSYHTTNNTSDMRKNTFDQLFHNSHQSRPQFDQEQQYSKRKRLTNIVRHFEEFKIEESEDRVLVKDKQQLEQHVISELQEDDIKQNFEEFKFDECDLSDDPDRLEADGSETHGNALLNSSQNDHSLEQKNINSVFQAGHLNSSSCYDNFLEASGMSNKSILTPSRLLSNHKSMLKPKDVKYKNKIKATATYEKHGMAATGVTHMHIKHWTGPFV